MSKKLLLPESYNMSSGVDDHSKQKLSSLKGCTGVIEFIIKDKNGRIVNRIIENNIIKIFSKEMLSHRLPSTEEWDPTANSGAGGWAPTGNDLTEEFSARYILLGASFDNSGKPIDNDPRYYVRDSSTSAYIPIRLGPGADFDGGLINGIPIAEPTRPLKRVESITYSPTYQPAGIPLLQDDVRAINNIVALQTTIQLSEYNGFGATESDFFVITEVALAGGKKFDLVGACELTPRQLFLEGPGHSSGVGLNCIAGGSNVVSINPSEVDVDLIKEGDQIKIVGSNDSAGHETVNQVSPFYLVIQKAVGGRDIILDRTPIDTNNNPIVGHVGVFRDTLRIFSHRILKTPVKKSADFEISVKWSIIFN